MVTGTGPLGEIRAPDVENFKPSAAAPAAAPAYAPAAPSMPAPAPAHGSTQYEDIPLTGMRKVRRWLRTGGFLASRCVVKCVA